MKRILLFLLLLCSSLSFGQVAYTAPGVFTCDEAAADLSTQTPYVLGNQDPTAFSVTYHVSQADADANVNPIFGLYNYSGTDIVYVFARVQEDATGDFAVSSMKVIWNLPDHMEFFQDQMACEPYALPDPGIGAFYTESQGQGYLLNPGDLVYNSMQIYWYAGNANCFIENTFFINVYYSWILPELEICESEATFNLYEACYDCTFFDQNNQQIPDAMNYPGVQGEMVMAYPFFCSPQPVLLSKSFCSDNIINGYVNLSEDGVACNPGTGLSDIVIRREDSLGEHFTYTNSAGFYQFYNVPNENVTLSTENLLPYQYDITEAEVSFFVPTNAVVNSPFCIGETPYTNAKVRIIPASTFRPGLNGNMILKVINTGNQPVSGTVVLNYDEVLLDYVSASITTSATSAGQLEFPVNLAAHTSSYITVTFNVPTTTVAGDVLNFTATVSGVANDAVAADNQDTCQKTVVNSYDPNDITVHEGAIITPEQADDYLHYTIRFQNTGTAAALNIKITSQLSALLDWSTFRPIASSHSYFVEMLDGLLTFRYPNINLIHQAGNDALSQGWVTFEVKPLPGLSIGQVIAAQAGIYFDFNEPVITNEVTTQLEELSVSEQDNLRFSVHPNPASDKIFLTSSTAIDRAEIINMTGKTVLTASKNASELNVSDLSSGLYFVKAFLGNDSAVRKISVK